MLIIRTRLFYPACASKTQPVQPAKPAEPLATPTAKPEAPEGSTPMVVFVLGLPGAGKSSYVRKHASDVDTVIIFDHIRRAMGHTYHKSTEPAVHFVANTMLRCALMAGHDVWIDESITELAVAESLVAVAREYGARVSMRLIEESEHVCWQRRVQALGFPQADFERKQRELRQNATAILSLADAKYIMKPFNGNKAV